MRKQSIVALGLVLAASSPALAMSAGFSWKGVPRCSGVSPAFSVSGAPAGTKSLRFALRDYDAPNFDHRGSTVPYNGGKIAQGAIDYIGPCPPPGQTHRYIWTIEALDASGSVLTAITRSAAYPP